MAIIEETFESQKITGTSNGQITMVREFRVYLHDPAEAYLCGPKHGEPFGNLGIYVTKKQVTPRHYTGDKSDGASCTLTVTYESPTRANSNSLQLDVVMWDVDIATQMQHITAVTDYTKRTTYCDESFDHNFLDIGRNEDELAGVDIEVPSIDFMAKVMRRASCWTSEYEQTVYGMSGKANSKVFRGWAVGDVLFRGVQKSDSGDGYISLTYKFRGEKTREETMAYINGSDTVEKKGMDYLWPQHGTHFDTSTEPPTQTKGVIAIHVDEVYDRVDFADLGLT